MHGLDEVQVGLANFLQRGTPKDLDSQRESLVELNSWFQAHIISPCHSSSFLSAAEWFDKQCLTAVINGHCLYELALRVRNATRTTTRDPRLYCPTCILRVPATVRHIGGKPRGVCSEELTRGYATSKFPRPSGPCYSGIGFLSLQCIALSGRSQVNERSI